VTSSRHVVFSHGKESGPWGTKIVAMAETARAAGCQVESIDYRGIDTAEGRVDRLVEVCKDLRGELVLVGSSLGGFVATAAASFLHARGVFLLAPAFYMDGLPALPPKVLDCPVEIVHGWHDEVVPLEHSLRFAREYGAALHVINDDHRLQGSIGRIRRLFEYFLLALDLPPEPGA
jgi:pimeloyl-ACP methyl ester carboxylesterase